MTRAGNFHKVMKRDRTGYLERMTLPSCVGSPGAAASCSKASAFPTGAPGASAGPSGPFRLAEGKQLNDETLMRETLPDAPVWGSLWSRESRKQVKQMHSFRTFLLSSTLCQVPF